jgi:hypothetical protein
MFEKSSTRDLDLYETRELSAMDFVESGESNDIFTVDEDAIPVPANPESD